MAAEAAAPQILILPALIVGIIIGFIELSFVHADERGMSWLSHGLHAIPVMLVFIFISMNISWALSLVNMHNTLWVSIGVRVLIGIIAMVKIAAAAAIAGRVGEKKFHVLIIGLLVIAAPFLWDYVLAALIGQYLPF